MNTLQLSNFRIQGTVAGRPLAASFRSFPAGTSIPRGTYSLSFAGENAVYGEMLALTRDSGAGALSGRDTRPASAYHHEFIEFLSVVAGDQSINTWPVTSRRIANAPGLVIDEGFKQLVAAVRSAGGIRLVVI